MFYYRPVGCLSGRGTAGYHTLSNNVQQSLYLQCDFVNKGRDGLYALTAGL